MGFDARGCGVFGACQSVLLAKGRANSYNAQSTMNAFESTQRKMIPAVLIYARRPNAAAGEDDVLMIYRKDPKDFHSGKYNGLGGKAEADESMIETASREFEEEAGIRIASEKFRILGQLHFPNFKPHKNEDWMVTVLEASLSPEVEPAHRETREGELRWVPVSQVASLNLWEGDRHFLPWVFERQAFHGTFWYREGKLAKYELQRLS